LLPLVYQFDNLEEPTGQYTFVINGRHLFSEQIFINTDSDIATHLYVMFLVFVRKENKFYGKDDLILKTII